MKTNSPEEQRTKEEMTKAYKCQEPGGWTDWGMFTAHVVHNLRKEVNDLRSLLTAAGASAPMHRDPFD